MAEITSNQKVLVGYMTRGDQYAAHGFDLILKNAHPDAFFDELRRAGLFDPEHNPKPQPVRGKEGFFRIPYWTALTYLNHVASIAGKASDIQLGNKVMEVVRAIANYREGDSAIDNYHTFSKAAEILGTVPPSCVTLADVDLAEGFLSTHWGNSMVVPELDRAMKHFLLSPDVDDHAKAVRLLEHCTKLKAEPDPERSFRTNATIADAYWLGQLLEHHAERLGQLGETRALDCLLARLRQLFGDEYISTHSWLWRPAVEEHEQNHDWDHITNAFVDSARDCLSGWIQAEPDAARAYVAGMLRDESQIVRRIAINAVRTHWGVLEGTLIDALTPELFDIGHLHELYLLLRERFPQLNQKERQNVVEIILQLDRAYVEDSEGKERSKYQQLNWLDAIKDLGDLSVDDAYRQLTESIGPLRENPDLLSYHTTWVGTGPSPFSEDELIAFADDGSLIARLNAFEPPKDERRSSRKSLIDALGNAVQARPLEFIWTLNSDMRMNRCAQYGLIHGFSKYIDGAKEGEDASWLRQVLDVLIPYLASVVGDETFWQEPVAETGAFEPNKNWIPSVVVEIAKKLVSNDDVSLVASDFGHLLGVILAIKEHAEGVEPSDDPMTAAINNARGNSVEALLQFVLRRCRESDKADGGHAKEWESLRGAIDAELARCVDGKALETSTLFASYLSQLLYIDKDWVRSNIGSLFPFAHIKNLVCAIAGLSFANANPRVYSTLKDADVLKRALQMADVKGSARERLIERVALAYIWGDEPLDAPLLSEMFSDGRVDDLVELSTTVARWSREKMGEDQVKRAKQLAAAITAFAVMEPSSRGRLLAAAAKFIGYVAKPADDDMGWLVQVAPFAHGSHGDDDFLDALNRMASEDPQKTLVILEVFLRDYELGYDYRGHLQSTVRKLYAAGLHPNALGIVDQMVKAGGGPKWIELYKELTGMGPPAAAEGDE